MSVNGGGRSGEVDPEFRAYLQQLAASGAPSMHEVGPERARRGYLKLSQRLAEPDDSGELTAVDTVVPVAEGPDIPIRVLRHRGPELKPTIVYLHGGGWVIGDLETHDHLARRIARGADATVVSVEYRLAPEHPFPAAFEDALRATSWVLRHSPELGGTGVVGLAGDSAGGNLAVAVSQRLRDGRLRLPDALFIAYPLLDLIPSTRSRATLRNGYLLEAETLDWFVRQYAGSTPVGQLQRDLRANPLNGSFARLPPTFVVVAEFDPLRDEGLLLASRMRRDGVDVRVVEGAGMIHGFLELYAVSPEAKRLSERLLQAFGEALRRVPEVPAGRNSAHTTPMTAKPVATQNARLKDSPHP
jgi:acetyl esterase